MAYIGKSPSTGVRNRFIYTATAGQTTFSGTDDYNRTLSYTDAEFTDVFLNGVKLDKSDYTATSGTSIVLDSGATVGDTLEVLGFDTFSVFSGDFSQDVTIGGAATVSGDLTITDKIVHAGDTNTTIRFPAADTVTIETAGSERMRVLSDGKVGIGTTTAEATLDVMGNSDSVAALKLNGGNDNHGFHFLTRATEGDLAINREVGGTQTEAMRIQRSDGAVGIAGTPSNATLDVHGRGRFLQNAAATTGAVIIRESSGGVGGHIQFVTNDNSGQRGFIASNSSSALLFGTAGNEAMRIDASPQVLMGKTVANLTTAGSLQAANATSDGSPAYFYMIKTFDGTRNAWLNYHNGAYVGGINMTNTSTSFPTLSDERLKKNIVDAPSAGDKIDAMQVRSFNWKADDSFQEYGLIAQELEAIYDLPVEQHDAEDTLTVDYSKLVPVLLKEIQDLRKRVATLENN